VKQPQPKLADLFVVLAWISLMSTCACDLALNQLGFLSPEESFEEKRLTMSSRTPEAVMESLKVNTQIDKG